VGENQGTKTSQKSCSQTDHKNNLTINQTFIPITSKAKHCAAGASKQELAILDVLSGSRRPAVTAAQIFFA
jgi:hypothetical protein